MTARFFLIARPVVSDAGVRGEFMSCRQSAHKVFIGHWVRVAGAIAAFSVVSGATAVCAATLDDPPVFASQNGVLDIMMVAIPQPIPTIAFTPPHSTSAI